AENCYAVRAGPVLLFCEETAVQRLYAEHGQEVGCYLLGLYPLRIAASGQVEALPRHRSYVFKGLVLGLPVGVVGGRRRILWEPDLGSVFPYYGQVIGVIEVERPQQHRVHQTEDRSVGADPQSKRQNGD